MRRYEKKPCPLCGSENATVGSPFTLQSKEFAITQTFVQVACRGACLKLHGPSKKTALTTRHEHRFRHAVPEGAACINREKILYPSLLANGEMTEIVVGATA